MSEKLETGDLTDVAKSAECAGSATRRHYDFTPDSHDEELFITQQAFRSVMDAMARPGLIHEIPPFYQPTLANPWLETLVCMLIDSSCSFCVVEQAGAEATLCAAISARTYAQPVACEQADFALIVADANPCDSARMIASLNGGTDVAPDTGATVLVECSRLGHGGHRFAVSGPGVLGIRKFEVSCDFWLAARAERGDEFPCGIDLILVDRLGQVLALPRTAQVTALPEPRATDGAQTTGGEQATGGASTPPAPTTAKEA